MEKNDKTILCEDDAAKIVEELLDAKNSAHHLGLKLNLKPTDVEAIQKMNRDPKDQLLEIIIKALRQGKLTWRAIVDALRSDLVGLTALADKVERAHFPDLASSNESVSGTAESATPTTSNVKSKNQNTKSKSDEDKDEDDLPPEKKKMKTDSDTGGNVLSTSLPGLTGSLAPVTLNTGSAVSTASDGNKVKSKFSPVKGTSTVDVTLPPMKKTIKTDSATGGNVPLTSVAGLTGSSAPYVIPNTGSTVSTTSESNEVKSKSSPVERTSGSVEEVKADISSFHQRFNSLKDITITALKKCQVAVMTVVYILTNIRTVQGHKFLKENHKTLRQSNDHLELFGSLNFYWNYLSYDLLDHLITELNKQHKEFDTVATEMAIYKEEIQKFRKRTPLNLFCKAEPQSHYEDPPAGFRKMVIRFDWPDDKTLEDVEIFRRRYASNYDLPTCAMMLNSIGTGSVTVTFFIHVFIQELLGKKVALDLKEFNVTRVEIHTSTTNIIYQAPTQKSVLRRLSQNWKPKKSVPPPHKLGRASLVVIDGMVYSWAPDPFQILRYNIMNNSWSLLPPIEPFRRPATIFSFNGKLILLDDYRRLRRWNNHSFILLKWSQGQLGTTAVGYDKYIIACNYNGNLVHVYDHSSDQWLVAQSVPMPVRQCMSSAVVGDYWYLSSYEKWYDEKDHIYYVHLPTLISTATKTASYYDPVAEIIWEELPKSPVSCPTLLDFHGHLLLIGGKEYTKEIYRYDCEAEEWKVCGQLPIGLFAPCCAVLPSGELMVAGGQTAEADDSYSNKVWTTEVCSEEEDRRERLKPFLQRCRYNML